jgi:hypothetical protein
MYDIFITVSLVCITLMITLSLARQLGLNTSLAVTIALWHTVACITYWFYAQTAVSDTALYIDAALSDDWTWSPGNGMVIAFTSLWLVTLAFSEFNVYFVFNIFGVVGLLLLAHSLLQVWPSSTVIQRIIPRALLFLPGLSFWTSAIGKDAPAFMSACLMVFAVQNISHRKRILAVSVAIMFSVRPHIAVLMMAAITLGLISDRSLPARFRASLLALAALFLFTAVPFAITYTGLSSPDDLIEYIGQRQDSNQDGSTSIDLAAMSIPMAFFSYLFRPLMDSSGLFGAIVSVENIIYFLLSMRYGLTAAWLAAPITHRTNAMFVGLCLLVLAMTTANLGIAIRQKTMLLPSLFVLIAFGAKASAGRRAPSAASAGPLVHGALNETSINNG